jgi:hypothetical protein
MLSPSMPTEYKLSGHARDEMGKRQIPEGWLQAVLAGPEQTILEGPDKEVLQSRFTWEDVFIEGIRRNGQGTAADHNAVSHQQDSRVLEPK